MKRVLIITYYWPPAGGIGVLRCLKIAKYLRRFGWEPVIYTAEKAAYPYEDQGNFKDIPEGIEVIKGPIWEPFALFKKLSGRKSSEAINNVVHVRTAKQGWVDRLAIWVRGNYFIPDARAKWIKPSVKLLSKYLSENPVDAIFSDGPPHTNTRIAGLLNQQFDIPWLADFQDPWTQVDYYQLFPISKKADALHRKMEQETFEWASKITIASPSWAKDLEAIGAKDVSVLYYGYDEADFEGKQPQMDQKFTIVHTGLLGHDRSPDNLLKVCQELSAEQPEFAQDLALKWIGQVDFSVIEKAKELGLEGNLNLVGTVDRNAAIQATLNAQLLLLPLNKAENIKGRLPGKLYEYLRSRRPIIVLGPSNADAVQIVEESMAGAGFDYSDVSALKTYISQQYRNFKAQGIPATSGEIGRFANERLTGQVAQWLNEITSDN